MRRSRTVGSGNGTAWVTRAEAAYLARVSIDEVDRWIASGRLANRQVGSVVLVDLSGLEGSGDPAVGTRSVRDARARSGRAHLRPRPAPERKTDGRPAERATRAAAAPDVRPAEGATGAAAPAVRSTPVTGSRHPVDPARPMPSIRPIAPARRSEVRQIALRPPADERKPGPAVRAIPATRVAPVDLPLPPTPSEPSTARRRATRRRARVPRAVVAVVVAAGGTVAILIAIELIFFGVHPRPVAPAIAAPGETTADASPSAIPVGRDPFATPFETKGKGDDEAGILVKPPGVLRDGNQVVAAATVVNQSDDRWLPPSEVTFVARDATGHVIARTTTTVTLGPGASQTVVAPNLGVDATAIAAIEADIDPAPMRTKGYRPPSVTVTKAVVAEGGKAIEGSLEVGPHAGSDARLACVAFDPLDDLASVGSTTVDLSKATNGHIRFWLTAQPDRPGPYHVACSVSL